MNAHYQNTNDCNHDVVHRAKSRVKRFFRHLRRSRIYYSPPPPQYYYNAPQQNYPAYPQQPVYQSA